MRFSETIRLPQPWLGMLVGYVVLITAGLGILLSVASLTSGQRILFGAIGVVCAAFMLAGPLWYIAMNVVVNDETITRRVGHTRRRIALSDINATRIEPGQGNYGIDRLVLTLADGSEYPVATRRPHDLASKINPWRSPPVQSGPTP